jgi:hypothetical protein
MRARKTGQARRAGIKSRIAGLWVKGLANHKSNAEQELRIENVLTRIWEDAHKR